MTACGLSICSSNRSEPSLESVRLLQFFAEHHRRRDLLHRAQFGNGEDKSVRYSAGRVEHKLERPDRAPTLTGRQPFEPDATPVRPGRISAQRRKRPPGRRRCCVFFFVAAASVPVLEIDPKVLDRLAAELNSHICERILRVEIGEHMRMGIEKRDRLLTPETRGVDGCIRGTDVNRVHGLDLVTVSRVLRREPLVHRIQKSVQTIVDGGGESGFCHRTIFAERPRARRFSRRRSSPGQRPPTNGTLTKLGRSAANSMCCGFSWLSASIGPSARYRGTLAA